MTRINSRGRRIAAALGVVGAAAALAAVAGAAPPKIAQAQALVDKFKAVPEWVTPGPAFDARKAAGKTVFHITISGIPTCRLQEQAAAKIAKKIGMKFITYPNQGQPSQWVAGVTQAVDQKVDLIVLHCGVNPHLLQPQLKRAKAAGIPVLVAFDYESGHPVPAGATEVANVPSHELSTLLVDYAIAADQGKVNALIMYPKEIEPAPGIVAAMIQEFKKLCPTTCKWKAVNSPVVEWATKLQSQVQSELLKDPSINYVIPIYDGMEQWVVPGIVGANAEGRVKSVSDDASPFALRFMQQGKVIVAETGLQNDWLAYATMDQALRMLTGTKTLKGYDAERLIPGIRLFDKTNIKEVGVPPRVDQATGWGSSYRTGYEHLWGLVK